MGRNQIEIAYAGTTSNRVPLQLINEMEYFPLPG
jgi:hypothetical protein